jgi:hypothetical protein
VGMGGWSVSLVVVVSGKEELLTALEVGCKGATSYWLAGWLVAGWLVAG